MDIGAILTILLAFIVVFFFTNYARLVRWSRARDLRGAVPEPEPSHWLLGHVGILARERLRTRELRLRWMQTCPRVYRTLLSRFQTRIVPVHADAVQTILRTADPKNTYSYSFIKIWLGDGLLISHGRKWARDRRLLTHCFHFDILRSYVTVYADACGVMLQKWSAASSKGGSVDVTTSITLITLDIMLQCAMGFDSNCQVDNDPEKSKAAKYAASVRKLLDLIAERVFNIFHHVSLIYWLTPQGRECSRLLRILHDMSTHLIAERKAALGDDATSGTAKKEAVHKYRDFLDVLLTVRDEEGKGLSDEEIREQVDTFLFEGHDTTSSALQWTIYYLSQHEDLQEKCRREVQDVLQKSGHSLETLSHDDLNGMTYLTQFIKESMRISSPVPYILRETSEEMQMDKYKIPEGTGIFIPICDVHVNAEHWPDPFKFDPDRFSPEQSKGRHPYAFIPFSAGPRNCIGQTMAMDEMKTIIASAVHTFKIAPDPSEPPPIWRPATVSRFHANLNVIVTEAHHE